jgi:DNA-binding CsgD family transcriptional regulator
MTETRKLRVFLCHASQDKTVVRELYERLNAEGWIDPWLDKEKLLPGQRWGAEIEKAVENTDVVIVCISNNSVNKEGYVQKEIGKALDIAEQKPEGIIFLIPIRLDNCQLPRRLQPYQYADYFPNEEKEKTIQKILASLQVRLGGLINIPYQSRAFEKDGMSLAKLSKQEQYILLLVSEGKTNREIARTMFLSFETVRVYVSNILTKLDMPNRAELAAFAVEHNLRNIIRDDYKR